MLFHSPGFLLIFLPLLLVVLHLCPAGTGRSVLLLFFSYLFYSGAEPFFVILLIISSVVDYIVALRLEASTRHTTRRVWLATSIMVNMGILFVFKYADWFFSMFPEGAAGGDELRSSLSASFVLPAGISFYTFQSMAYSIDVYRHQIRPEKNLISFCNYVAYLPQLIAGPIERYSQLGHQINTFTHGKTKPLYIEGLNRLSLGIVLKLLVADTCGNFVDRIAMLQAPPDLLTAWSIAMGFGLQILYDFSAYTHMAVGIALMMGVRLSENFLAPYQAANIQAFWRRWHVTLSSWFRDYVYISLGGNRQGLTRTIVNLWITFLLCGLWHGAGYNYLLWGALHGILLSTYKIKQYCLPDLKLSYATGLVLTLSGVLFAWIPFRFSDMNTIYSIWQGMLGMNDNSIIWASPVDMLIIVLIMLFTLILPHAKKRPPGSKGPLEALLLYALALYALSTAPTINQFIYFQF